MSGFLLNLILINSDKFEPLPYNKHKSFQQNAHALNLRLDNQQPREKQAVFDTLALTSTYSR